LPEIIRDAHTSETLKINDDGSINVGSSIVSSSYDYIDVSEADSVTEVYTFKEGGVLGSTVSTVTIVYSDSSKNTLLSVARS